MENSNKESTDRNMTRLQVGGEGRASSRSEEREAGGGLWEDDNPQQSVHKRLATCGTAEGCTEVTEVTEVTLPRSEWQNTLTHESSQ